MPIDPAGIRWDEPKPATAALDPEAIKWDAPAAAPQSPGLLEAITQGIQRGRPGEGITRGATSTLASSIHVITDALDQAMAPTTALYGYDPLKFDKVAAQSLSVENEINKDRQAAAERIGGQPGLGDLLRNPTAGIEQGVAHLTNMGSESIPMMMAAIATRNPELGAALMGGTTGAQEYTDLRGQGVPRHDAATAAGLTGAIETAGEAIGLPAIMGKSGKGSLVKAMLENAAQEAPVQVAQQYVEDQATGKQTPIAQQLSDALDAALVGGALGAGGHVASNAPAAAESLIGRLMPTKAATVVAPATTTPPVAPVTSAPPEAPPAQAPPTSLDAMLDALLSGQAPAVTPAPTAATPDVPAGITPATVRDAMERAAQAATAPIPEATTQQQSAAPVEPVRNELQSAQDKSSAVNDELAQQGMNDTPPWWMGARGGEPGFEAQKPATSGFPATDEASAPAAPVNLDALRDEIGWDQQGGQLLRAPEEDGQGGHAPVTGRTTWVPKAGQNGEESNFWRMRPEQGGKISEKQAKAALDKHAAGQPLNAREQRFIDYAQQTQRQYDDAYDAQLREFQQDQADDSSAGVVAARRALQEESIPPGDHAEALTLQQLVSRAYDAGADPTHILDATFDGTPAEQARRLWDLTRQLDERHATDTRAIAPRREDGTGTPPEGASAVRTESQGEGFTLATPEPRADAPRQVTQQSGLFAPPTPADHIRAATESRDAERNGLAGSKVDTGDGGLFDGKRPEQTRVPDALDSTGAGRQLSIDQGNADADRLGLRNAVRKALGPVADRVEYLHGYEGLPENMRRGVESRNALGRKGVTAAMYSPTTGRVFIFTQVTKTPERAVWHAAHEIAGHEGLRTLLGDRLDHALNIARQNPTVKALADEIYQQRKIGEQMKKSGHGPGDGFLLATEEALAELAAAVRTGNFEHINERYGLDVPPGIRERVKAAIDTFLRRLKVMMDDLFGKHVFNDADVRSLLEAAWQSAQAKDPTASVRHPDGSSSLEQVGDQAVDQAGVADLERKIEADNPGVSLDISRKGDVITLGRIVADKQGQGIGTKAMGQLIDYADANGLRIALTPSSDFGGSKPRLREFYKRFGFKNYNGFEFRETMVREPQSGLDSTDDQTGTPEFRKWFGDSKAVDARGKPLVVYHGAPDVRFMQGDATFKSIDQRYNPESTQGGVHWFTPDRSVAATYADDRRAFDYQNADAGVIGAYLKIENPLVIDGGGKPWREAQSRGKTSDVIEQAQAGGHDGVIIRRVKDDYTGLGRGSANRTTDTYAVFDSRQIKSATGNRGTFDPDKPSILESTDYTPEQKEFMRKAGMADAVDTRTGVRRALDALRGVQVNVPKDALIQGGIDKFHGIKRAVAEKGGVAPEDNPYLAAEMIQTASTMEAVLRFGAPELHGGALRVKRDVPGLMDALAPVAKQMPQWLGWMVARRAKVLKAQGRENAMTDADIAAGLSLATGHEQAFKEAAVGYLKLKNTILDLAEQTGIIDPEARKVWDHAEYIPFYRDMDAGYSGPGTRQGLSNQSSGIRTLKGGESPLKDPLGNIIANFTRLIDASMKNRATLLAVDKLGAPYFRKAPLEVKPETIPLDQIKRHLLTNGTPQSIVDTMPASALTGVGKMLAVKAPEGDDIVRVMRNGKAEYYHVDDPLLLRSLTSLHEGGTHWAIKPFVWTKQLLTAGATATPDFLIRNALRDTGEASVTAQDKFIPVWDTLRGAVDSFRESELSQDLMMAGAAFHGGLFHTGNNEDTAKAIRRALRKHGMTDSAITRYTKTLINPKRLWDVYRSVSEATEMGSRVSLARNRLKAGASPLEAAHEAKDFLNFQRRGDDQFVVAFTKVIPFLNARIQGADRMVRVGTTKGRRGKMAARLAIMAMLSTALYAWNTLMHGDDYDEIPDWDKDANWHIAPGTSRYMRIPKPFELGLVGGTLPERMYGAIRYQLTNGERGDRPGQSWDAFVRGIMGALGINPIPQGVKPIVEDVANKDFYFGSPIEGMGDQYKAPSDRFGPTTSPVMRKASKAMAAMFGEDNAISPKRLEHFWNGYTAGMGRYLLDGADWAVRKLDAAPEQPAKSLRDFPLVGTVARGSSPPRTTRYVDEFYDLAEQAKQKSSAIKEAIDRDDPARAAKLEKRWGWLLGERQGSRRAKGGFMHAGVREINQQSKQLAEISKDNARIYEDRAMTPEKKRQALDANLIKRNTIVRKAVLQLREAQRRSGE